MKKQTKGMLIILALVVVLVIVGQLFISKQGNLSLPQFPARSPDLSKEGLLNATPTITQSSISIDFGDGRKIVEKVQAANIYEALSQIAKEKNMEVAASSHKYGVLVEKIESKT